MMPQKYNKITGLANFKCKKRRKALELFAFLFYYYYLCPPIINAK